ncbi:MAG TPA: BTAD domain-containing putative transcriptional regulator, partial [Pilimelia sp.]|nr:BTAD domain-containing putative transcriptional regulator [Pilimelia sp.]
MQVRVLGRLAAADGGILLPVEALPRRARQVLSVLAARYDRVQSKDALADAVWGGNLPGNHAAAVEHYVSLIRRTLQPGRPTAESFIVTRGSGYLLTTARVDLDLAELRRLVRLADSHAPGSADRQRARQRILDLVTDLPFADDEDAGWALAPRTEVRGAVLAALVELGTAALDADPERALRLAREAVELDGYLEPAYRIAMRAAATLGRSGEALRWYARCRDTLGADLGVSPSPETAALRTEIRAAHRPVAASAAPATRQPPAVDPPTVNPSTSAGAVAAHPPPPPGRGDGGGCAATAV